MKFSGANVQKFSLSPCNPAIAFAMLLGFYPGQKEGWASIWIFLCFGFLGSFCAFIFFRYIFKKTMETMDGIDELEREKDELEDEMNEELYPSDRVLVEDSSVGLL